MKIGKFEMTVLVLLVIMALLQLVSALPTDTDDSTVTTTISNHIQIQAPDATITLDGLPPDTKTDSVTISVDSNMLQWKIQGQINQNLTHQVTSDELYPLDVTLSGPGTSAGKVTLSTTVNQLLYTSLGGGLDAGQGKTVTTVFEASSTWADPAGTYGCTATFSASVAP